MLRDSVKIDLWMCVRVQHMWIDLYAIQRLQCDVDQQTIENLFRVSTAYMKIKINFNAKTLYDYIESAPNNETKRSRKKKRKLKASLVELIIWCGVCSNETTTEYSLNNNTCALIISLYWNWIQCERLASCTSAYKNVQIFTN